MSIRARGGASVRRDLRCTFEAGLRLLADETRRVGLCDGDVLLGPRFVAVDSGITGDAPCLGLYAVAFAIRWCRASANFLAAATAIVDMQLYSPSVLLSYTSAFQTLHANLALNGCVVVDPAVIEDSRTAAATRLPDALVCRLTKQHQWKIEAIRRSHSMRWAELKQVWRNSDSNRPAAFDALFEYFFSERWKIPPTLEGFTARLRGDPNPPMPVRWSIEEKADEFLREIAEVRHQAQYFGFGSDPHAFDAAMNDDYGPPMHLRSTNLVAFASKYLATVGHDLIEILTPLRNSKSLRDAIRLLTFFPAHDTHQTKAVADNEVRAVLDELDGLLKANAA